MLKKLLNLAQKDLYVQAVAVFAILLSITVVAVAYIKTADNSGENQEPDTSYQYETLPNQPVFSTNSAVMPSTDTNLVTDIGWQNTPTQQVTQNTQNNQNSSVYSWSKETIVQKLSEAVNKTKAQKNSFSVHHSESFNANITDCTGGSLGKAFANTLISAVVKPSDQMLSFSGGKATTQDGEITEILLPKNGAFSLSPAGVKTAKAYQEGDKTVLVVTLVREDCGISDIPQYNSKSIGYLDANSIDLMGVSITTADIQYTGSTIMVKINSSGLVTYAKYTIPMHVYGEGNRGSLSGQATFDGEQSEVWELPF